MSFIPVALSLLSLLLLCSVCVQAPEPFVVPWNTTNAFGYDGPWQAIPVQIGSAGQLVNLFPGGAWTSAILSTDIPGEDGTESGNSIPGDAGTYNASLSNPSTYGSTENDQIFASPSFDSGWGGWNATGTDGNAVSLTDSFFFSAPLPGVTVPNVSLAAIFDAFWHTPDGREIPLDVGTFSLGQDAPNVFTEGDGRAPFVGNMVSQWLFANKVTSSNTWGLHYGSWNLNIPGSLVFGGYDQNRVIGEIGTYDSQSGNGDMFVVLVDIAIGVATGASPFNFQNRSGLFQDDPGQASTVNVRLNPTVSALYLPNNTCKAIAELLPVTYHSDLGFYLWNTNDPSYSKIVTSPAFLSFSFQRADGQSPFEINVPFALLNLTLLNLTLAPPITTSPTPYFPCVGIKPAGETTNTKTYHLGRAFFQAAFIGMNWNTSTFWLSQAPGPAAVTQSVKSLAQEDEAIEAVGGSDLWTKSWDGHWTALSIASLTPAPTHRPMPQPGGLSTGAKAGIGVGAVASGLAALVFGILLWRRHQSKKLNRDHGSSEGFLAAEGKAATRMRTSSVPLSERYQTSELGGNELSNLSVQQPNQIRTELPVYYEMPNESRS
jgi:hypothetical protein